MRLHTITKNTLLVLALLGSVSLNAFASSHVANNKLIAHTDVGSGKPIVLIHPFPTDQRIWEPQREALKKSFRVITLDLWGFGKSSAVDGKAITMTEYADEVKQLIDQLHIKKAIIAGESMGGYVALAFYEKYPKNVSGLVLSDTQASADTMAGQKAKRDEANEILANGIDNHVKGFLPKLLSPDTDTSTRNFVKDVALSQSSTGAASGLRGMALRKDTSYLLKHESLPILIITGDRDEVISPKESVHMHKIAKDSELVIINNTSHLTSLAHPDLWNKEVIAKFAHKNN